MAGKYFSIKYRKIVREVFPDVLGVCVHIHVCTHNILTRPLAAPTTLHVRSLLSAIPEAYTISTLHSRVQPATLSEFTAAASSSSSAAATDAFHSQISTVQNQITTWQVRPLTLQFTTQENKAPHVQLYHDSDLLFTVFHTLLAVYLTFSHITLPASSSSGSSALSSTYARRSDGVGAASTNPCDQPELAELAALAAPGEVCEHWLERAAVSISTGMVVLTVVRVPAYSSPSQRITHTLRTSPSALTPSSEGADALLVTFATPMRMRIPPSPRTSPQ
ncbi:hypothetical protein C8J57DRAFT_1513601 [Mycena rebaudengoi]|nr:hypothetical protein C8J57DRAFT_1513601 [Mycena rebaudengoi]